jgi:hypothetical protein
MQNAHAARRSSRRLHLVLLVLAASLALVPLAESPVSAQPDPAASSGHIIGGSRIGVPGGFCTAGLVVKKDGLRNNLSAYQRAVRYVVTAKHCFADGDAMTFGGELVGTAVWRDPTLDLALVRVDPIVHNNRTCAPTSAGFHCVGSVDYEPRADGRVFLATLRTRSVGREPIVSTGTPPDSTLFCSSGATSGPDCTLRSVRVSPNMGLLPGEAVAARGSVVEASGDSGGLVCSHDGVAYGIIKGRLLNPGATLVTYTRIGEFFAHAPGRFSLAAP